MRSGTTQGRAHAERIISDDKQLKRRDREKKKVGIKENKRKENLKEKERKKKEEKINK